MPDKTVDLMEHRKITQLKLSFPFLLKRYFGMQERKQITLPQSRNSA
jgi:hypothetical protein